LACAAAIVVLREGEAVFVPVLASILLAYALEPIVVAFMRLRLPRVLASALLYLIIAIMLLTLARTARSQALGFFDDLPATIDSFRSTVTRDSNRNDPLARLQRAATDVQATMEPAAGSSAPHVRRVAPEARHLDVRRFVYSLGLTALSLTGRLSVVALLTFLLLVTGDFYKRKLVRFAGPRWEARKLTVDVIRTIDRQIERYLLVRVLISLIVAGATALGLWYLNMSHALVWGAIAGVLNTLPFVGPSVATVLITIAAFLQFRTVEATAAAGAVTAIIAALEGNLLSPWLTGRAGELNTVAVFVSVLFWGWMWDMWGLLLAVPIMVAVKAAADHIEPLQAFGELLGP
jgi:predicted PurR-regulated permease PerM